ncbi:MAG: hypothetical protein Q9227_008146 [Pyrenula ochraceoflavens]
MRTILPGRPPPKLQAVSIACWDGLRIIAYISGNALVILGGAQELLQTIYTSDLPILEAVTIDEPSGRIAVCGRSRIVIYDPSGREEGVLKWTQRQALEDSRSDAADINTLSWGSSRELLAGGSVLTLWSLYDSEEPRSIWSQLPSSPTKIASLSHDGTYIATSGQYDRLLKLWRRLSFDTEDVRFDTSYLPHPAAVTNIHWRRPWHQEQNMEDLLYTFCADNVVRIWAPTDPHGLQAFQKWGEIDMNVSIQPRNLLSSGNSRRRYGFIIDSRDFSMAAEKAVQTHNGDLAESHALEHLIEVAQRSPEICVIFDGREHLSAWGIENAGCKGKTSSSIFNIAHVEGLSMDFGQMASSEEDYAQIYSFPGGSSETAFTILVQCFDGRINWYDTNLTKLFDTALSQKRVSLQTSWSGHDGPIKKVVRTVSGRAIISRTDENHGIVWKQVSPGPGRALIRQSSLISLEHIHRSCILAEGDFVMFLHHESVSLWDTRGQTAEHLDSCNYSASGKLLCLLLLPAPVEMSEKVYAAAIGSDMKGITWEVTLPKPSNVSQTQVNGYHPYIREFCTFDVGIIEEISYILPVDPAGMVSVASGFLDVFARDVAITYSASGNLRMLSGQVDLQKGSVDWLVTSMVETGILNPTLASGSSIRKAALVDETKTGLTIWDTTGHQLEYEQRFTEADVIQDLDWTSTPDVQSVLAVGFPHRVLVLTQLRYDYLNARPAWAPIREILTRDLSPHPIGDSCWLGNGALVVGAGNQLFVYDQHLDLANRYIGDLQIPLSRLPSKDMFAIVQRLNGPLPVFHPQFVAQCVLSGKIDLVHRILTTLHRKLKFWTEDDEIESFLEFDVADFLEEPDVMSRSAFKEMRSSSYIDISNDEESETVDDNVATILNENLAKMTLPQLSSQEQFHLADIVECVALVAKHSRSMDTNAAKYLLFFRQHMLRRTSAPPSQRVTISWREIVWALHSGSQDILLDLVSRQFQSKMFWEQAREAGVFLWLSDVNAVRSQLETIARNEYTGTDERNPVDCSLYYLALRKKTVLQGLWRMATWNREQASTSRLLANDFTNPRWKTAALKNAYALLGRRRFHYAAAFFLLADSLQDAANVCAVQLNDIQLAVAITRAYEGDNGPVLQNLINDQILPNAAETGNRWMATWAFWFLRRRDLAVRALVEPVHDLVSPAASPSSPPPPPPTSTTTSLPSHSSSSTPVTKPQNIPTKAKSYLSNDPALVVLYQTLREKSLQTLQGATMVPPRVEWDFVLRNARLYSRMGCDLLALALVRGWEFLKTDITPKIKPKEKIGAGGKPSADRNDNRDNNRRSRPDLRTLLRRRSSLVVDDLALKSPTATSALQQSSSELIKSSSAANWTRSSFQGHARMESSGSLTASTIADGTQAIPEEDQTPEQSRQENIGDGMKKQKEGEKKRPPPPPTAFQEPDPNALLDSFGF